MGIIIKKPRYADLSKYNFAYVNPSAAHTYGNVTAIMVNYLKSLFGDNYFKYIHVATKIAYKEFDFRKNTTKESFKKEKPMLIIRPRVVLDDGDFFMSNTPLTRKLTDNFFIKDDGDLMPFFHDDKNNIFVKYGLNRMCMEFDVMIVTETVMEQLNIVNSFKNRVRQDMNFTLETALESYVPQNIIDLLSHDSKLPVFDENNKVKRFLDYMNCHSGFPITYKLKGSSNRDEFFRYYNAKLDTRISGLQFDDGNKKGMAADTATITFNVRTEFWGAGMYYYFTLEEIPFKPDEIPSNLLHLFSTTVYKSIGLPEGYKVYTTAAFKTDDYASGSSDSIEINQLINSELEQLIDYCNSTGTSLEPFMKVVLFEDGLVLEDSQFSFDIATKKVTVNVSNHLSTYRIYVYINQLYLNNFIKDVIGAEFDTNKVSVDSSLKDNSYDVTLPPHYKITDNAVIDKENLLITDIPNEKPCYTDDKDYRVYIGKISSSVPNSRNLDRDYVYETHKASSSSVKITSGIIDNQSLVICIPEEFRNVKRIYYTNDPFKKDVKNEFNFGYIELKGSMYRYYMMGKDVIDNIDLTFDMV